MRKRPNGDRVPAGSGAGDAGESQDGIAGERKTLAYAVFPAYQRKGYMLETLQAVIPELFGNAGAEYIHCGHFEENNPSRELLRKLGFREYASHQVRDRLIIDEILRRGV